MKKELDTYKMSAWTWVMLGCAVAAMIAAVPIIVFKDTVGWPTFIPCVALWGFAVFAAIKVELIKKKHNLKTYSEILAFVKNSPLDREKMAWSKKHPTLAFLAKLLLGVAFALVVFVIAYFF